MFECSRLNGKSLHTILQRGYLHFLLYCLRNLWKLTKFLLFYPLQQSVLITGGMHYQTGVMNSKSSLRQSTCIGECY